MRKYQIFLTLIFILLAGCSGNEPVTMPDADLDDITHNSAATLPGYHPWGFYDFEIARDGSYAKVVPNRATNGMWGYHMNVVKLLEVDPCTNCLNITNIHLLPTGDVSVDISIKHPYMDRRYTGFDVRGIIMFPASQYYPDNNIREIMGLDPYYNWKLRIANHEYGDAELMNPDGWTVAWTSEEAPGAWNYSWYNKDAPDEDMPIFRYYPGKFASGEDLSTLSAFIRFHSTDTRHMFEIGQTVTRTYIIRPPASGPIKASYAVYAHWYPADNIPVVDPAVDFPPEANSPLPYEFYITQDAPIDPDAPLTVIYENVHWHIKTWSIGSDLWHNSVADLGGNCLTNYPFVPHPSGEPDDYLVVADYFSSWLAFSGGTPGAWNMLCGLGVYNPKDAIPTAAIGCDTYLARFEYAAWDGSW